MGAGWDINTTFAFWSLVVGIIGLLFAAFAFLPGWADYRDWLKADPDYRLKTAAALRDRRWVVGYRGWLEAGLDWLDRRFGEANSSRALGVCTVISLCYAWAAFFVGYGAGAPGRLGEIELLPVALGPRDRWILVASAVVLPVAAFVLGRWLGGFADRGERRIKAWLLSRRRQARPITRRRFEYRYRLICALVVLALFLSVLTAGILAGENSLLFVITAVVGLGIFIAVGPVFGLAAAKQVRAPWLKGPAAGALALALAGTGAVAGALALAVAVAVAGALAGAIAGAVVVTAGALAGAVVVVGALGMALALALAGTLAGAGAGAGAVALALAVAVAAAVAIGAVTAGRWARQDRRGAVSGGVGAMLVFAILGAGIQGNVDDSTIIFIITFLFLLPLANGLWDWLSWRISRWLGRDLLEGLDESGRGWTIISHGLADLLFALLFLATLALALAFGMESYNQYAVWRSGETVYDLRVFVGEAAEKPWTEGFWLTAMLLSTLVPTFLHFALLLASPLVMLVTGSPKRTELAAALHGYDAAEEKDAILQRVGWHLARSQYLAWVAALLLTILLLVLFGTFIGLVHQGGLADYVAGIALFAIDVTEWCFGR